MNSSANEIAWIQVKSTNLAAYAYVASSERLYVRFLSGHDYCYLNVPEDLVLGLANADSKGRFVALHIVGFFDYERIF
jgi:hypothetical protein